jgi:hypothetical protein
MKLTTIILNIVFLSILFTVSSLRCVSQDPESIDLKEVSQKQLRKFIEQNKIDKTRDFSSIHSSWKKNSEESDFHFNEKTFYLKNKLSKVWESYRHADLARALMGHSVRFGLMISKKTNSVIYDNNKSMPDPDTGQIFFLCLKVLKGIFKLPVAFEIINIDPEKQILEFSYLDDNKAKGKQTLMFFDNGEESTRIVHRSYFKSGSPIRDELLYPYFHTKFIKGYHKNMKRIIKA